MCFLYNLERSPLQQSAGTGVIPGAGNDPFATTPQQLIFYQNLFIQLDKDKDHKVKHDELITYHSQSGLPKEVLERLYQMSDLDHDGEEQTSLPLHQNQNPLHLLLTQEQEQIQEPDVYKRQGYTHGGRAKRLVQFWSRVSS